MPFDGIKRWLGGAKSASVNESGRKEKASPQDAAKQVFQELTGLKLTERANNAMLEQARRLLFSGPLRNLNYLVKDVVDNYQALGDMNLRQLAGMTEAEQSALSAYFDLKKALSVPERAAEPEAVTPRVYSPVVERSPEGQTRDSLQNFLRAVSNEVSRQNFDDQKRAQLADLQRDLVALARNLDEALSSNSLKSDMLALIRQIEELVMGKQAADQAQEMETRDPNEVMRFGVAEYAEMLVKQIAALK